jgi:hypothetical protein
MRSKVEMMLRHVTIGAKCWQKEEANNRPPRIRSCDAESVY